MEELNNTLHEEGGVGVRWEVHIVFSDAIAIDATFIKL